MKTDPENRPAPSSEPTTTAETIRTLCDFLFEYRVSSDVLIRHTGIDPGYLAHPRAAFHHAFKPWFGMGTRDWITTYMAP